jgi:diphosphomevalonate decarboxylase
MTLGVAVTQTSVHVSAHQDTKGLVSVNGDPFHPFLPKMRALLQQLDAEIPFLPNLTFTARTRNHFPHSTGIASSASGLSAFALCILEAALKISSPELFEKPLLNRGAPQPAAPQRETQNAKSEMRDAKCEMRDAKCETPLLAGLQHMASYAARLGSGSACRSLYGGFTAWGMTNLIEGSSDDWALPLSEKIHPEMLSVHDAILVVSARPKELSSSQGHAAMTGHPFVEGRIGQANRNFGAALEALSSNDFEKLGAVAECEALTLHALLMSACPGTILMLPATVEIMHRVRAARKSGLPLFFTLDAGANVHVLYPHASAWQVEKFITANLQPLCEEGRVIFDACGAGPVAMESPVLTLKSYEKE